MLPPRHKSRKNALLLLMDKLQEIMAHKRKELEARQRPVSDAELAAHGRLAGRRPSFRKALRRAEGLAVIAEIKRKSPSAGRIKELPEASEQARIYLNAEADAISVLTDEAFFGGHLKDLWAVADFLADNRRAVPCLRKDFMVHPIQVLEAAEAGASCILIIVRALSDAEIGPLQEAAELAGLDTLFEVHAEDELERALALGAEIIGVNNRDLARFRTDLAFSEKLIPLIPEGVVKISESGIFELEDAARARACGADAILVGEALMTADDAEALIEAWHGIDSQL